MGTTRRAAWRFRRGGTADGCGPPGVTGEVRTRRAGTRQAAVIAAALAGALASAGVAPGAPAAPQAAEAMRIIPAAPVQGDTLVVLVSAGPGRVSVTFDGSAVPAFGTSAGTVRALVATDPDVPPGSHTIRATIRGGDGTVRRLSRAVRLRPGHFAARRLTLPPETFGLINPRNLAIERQALGPVLGRRTPVAWWRGPFAAPSAAPMDSPYGEQGIYNGHREWWHQGVDFAAPADAPVTAANAGVVALARPLPLGGNTVVIDHGQGVLTEYLHLSVFAVREGDRVEKGALIGRIGATGLVTGPSLHWGLYVDGIPVNPLFWLEPRPGLTQ
jgi:murein DD-endopeptidase MepM/ murein hydrolase activator NlpD